MIDPTALPFKVFARDESLALVADLTDSLSELECRLAFNEVGGWSMTLAADAPGADKLAAVGHLRGIVVNDRNNKTVFSGPLTSVRRTGDGRADLLELGGACDNAILARRWARPDPAGPPYTAKSHDVRTNLADQVMAEYVDQNIGASATTNGHPERTVPGLVVLGVSGVGTTVTGRARFDNLLELLQDLAAAGGGLRFAVRQRDITTAQLEFVVTKPVDLTGRVVFDPEKGNLSGRVYAEAAPSANYVIAAGGGEGTQRIFTERGDAASIGRYGLREMFRDARDTDSTGILGQRIDETLAQSREAVSVEVDTIDTPTARYGVDYRLGDLVTTRVGAIETVGTVAGITLTINRETAAEDGVGMIRPLIQTLGVVKSAAGTSGELSRSGGLAGWLSRNAEGESIGTVKLWAGTIASIPAKWHLMDGTAGTTDMRGRFLVGADGDAGGPTSYPLFAVGGSATHTHTVTLADHTHTVTLADHTHAVTLADHTHAVTLADHAHSGAPHTHTVTTGGPDNLNGLGNNGGVNTPSTTHAHSGTTSGATFTGNTGLAGAASLTSGAAGAASLTSGAAGAASLTSAATDGRPPYRALLCIQRVSS